MKAYRIYLANGTYFGTYHISAEALKAVGATIKGNVARLA